MKIFLLTMWLYGHHASLIIGAFDSRAACEQVRPQYDRPYSFGICQTLTVWDDETAAAMGDSNANR